jgi:hypothetical protein
MSPHDLEEMMRRADEDQIDGIDNLSEELQAAVNETIETGNIVMPPERLYEAPPPPKAKTSRKKRVKMTQAEAEVPESEPEPEVKFEEPGVNNTSTLKAAEPFIKAEEQVEEGAVKVEDPKIKVTEQHLLPMIDNQVRVPGVKVEEAAVATPKPNKSRVKKVELEPDAGTVLQGSEGLVKDPQPSPRPRPRSLERRSVPSKK